MSIRQTAGQWLVPPAFHPLIRRLRLKARKDTNTTISPVQLRHIRRYEFARSLLRGSAVLDAACGAGYGSELLDPVERYVGLDYADYCIDYATAHYGAAHRSFIEGDILVVSRILAGQSFDTVVSFETLEHVADAGRALRELRKLLNPQGRIIASIPLNHPDLVYHKRQFTYDDATVLFRTAAGADRVVLEEYLQNNMHITPLETRLAPDAGGTLLAVITFAD